jgi:hypothetical protein
VVVPGFRISKWCLAAMLLVALAATANAFPVFYTAPQVFDTGLQRTNRTVTNLVFDKFDPSLGILTDVHIKLDAYGEVGYSITDLGGTGLEFQMMADVTVQIADPLGGPPLALTVPNVSDIARSVGPFGTYGSPGWPARTLTGTNSTGDLVYTDAAILTLFGGPGLISLPTWASIAYSMNADNDNSNSITSRYIGKGTVYYSYTVPVPEPATATLLLGGVACLLIGAIRRRKA